ncbi:uncharacterized protein LOC131232531 [Magnolia sinica]|uniref:uncharacterized protein LOC131232531 n=1 Tax=Magnolia sinica TaxID=86752 RepID=UPI0026595933|nr:uncharacterized protein LOC131232531 [Magnolia sinica]
MLCERYWPASTLHNDANSDKKTETRFEFYENGMLKGGHFDRDSTQRYTNSVREALRRTMLSHEAIFRNQVRELHRLYKVQQNLMNDLSRKEFEKFTAWTESAQATPISYKKATQYKRSAEEDIFPMPCSSTMVSPQTENGDVFVEYEGFYSRFHKLQRRTIDLQLPADEYIGSEGTGNLQASVNECSERKDFLCSKIIDDPEDLKLALSYGKEATKKGVPGRGHFYKGTRSYAQHVIDLEESIERVSDGEAKTVSSIDFEASITPSGTKHGLQLPALSDSIFSGRTGKDQDYKPFFKHSVADSSESRREWKSFDLNAGWNEHDSSPAFDFTQKHQSTSDEATNARLNPVQVDGSSSVLRDSAAMFPSSLPNSSVISLEPTSESHSGTHPATTCWRMPSNGCSNNTDANVQDSAAYSIVTNSVDKSTDLLSHVSQISRCSSTQISAQSAKLTKNTWIHDLNEVGPIDLESLPEGAPELHSNFGIEFSCDNGSLSLPPTGLCKTTEEITDPSQGDGRRDTLVVTPGFKIEDSCMDLLFGSAEVLQTVGDAECRQVDSEKSDDTVSSRQPENHVVVQGSISSPVEEKTSRVSNACNVKHFESAAENQQKMGHSILSALEDSGTTQLESAVTETSSNKEDTQTESGVYACLPEKSCEMKVQEHNELQQEQAAETDIAMRRAAESLINISLENTASSLDRPASAGPVGMEIVEMSDEPQYSSDSYESITLMLTESCMDEYSSSVMPFQEKELGDNASGLNLRRGRRMKDFQRDILPSLISLSRHEICEDMNIIGGVIRANEYRKNGCRRVRTENWCVPTRSRRSRLYCSNRRC